jgi:hypothetical protein
MPLTVRRVLSVVFLILAPLALPIQNLLAEEHAVSLSQLHQTLLDSAKTRQDNVEAIQRFFASKLVKENLSGRIMNFSKVEKAVPLLSDDELGRLASRCRQVETDIAAGSLTNEQITYILIALATAVVILVIVVA